LRPPSPAGRPCVPPRPSARSSSAKSWATDGLTFSNAFSGARANDLRRLGERRYLVVSRPEFRPINPSPWHAFEIKGEAEQEIEAVFPMDAANDFDDQYPPPLPSPPWLSGDGATTWTQLDEPGGIREGFTGTARLALPGGTARVCAFQPHTLEQVMARCDEWEKLPFVTASVIGLPAAGRLLRQFNIAETNTPRFLILMGGQHPPEGNGDRGLARFAEALRADTPLAHSFRKHFQTIVGPMVNPCGSFHGQSRGTLGGKEPNRDSSDQTLPELRATSGFLRKTRLVEGGTVSAFVDFHATSRDFFSVAEGDAPNDLSPFAARWFAQIAAGKGDFAAEAVPSPNHATGTPTSWARRVLKCPA